jgi:hypothetical protein
MKVDIKCPECGTNLTIDLDYEVYYCEECDTDIDTNLEAEKYILKALKKDLKDNPNCEYLKEEIQSLEKGIKKYEESLY